MIAKQGSGKRYYPVLLDLEGRHCVVVGGGQVAERKVRALLECGAKVVVIAPKVTRAIGDLARQGAIRLLPKAYEDGDLGGAPPAAGAWLVVAAARGRCAACGQVNAAVAAEARRQRIPVNVADDPQRCDFIVPAVVRRGPLLIAISSGGASPALARRLREVIEAQVGEEYGELARLLGRLRPEVLRITQEKKRRRIWQAILDSRVLELLRQGRRADAEREARRCISNARD